MKLYGVLKFFLYSFFLLLGFIAFQAWRSIPSKSGLVKLVGITQPVKVTKDIWGVPHIYAGDEAHSFRVLGHLMAGERLFQMDLIRRIAGGRISELVGEKGLKSDKLFRTLAFRDFWETQFSFRPATEKVQKAIKNFVDGINGYIYGSVKPIEYYLLGISPEPFTIYDVYLSYSYISFNFAGGFKHDPLMTKIKNSLDSESFRQLRYDFNEAFAGVNEVLKEKIPISLAGMEHQIAGIPQFDGSNAWVLGGDRTISGAPILANDPHMGFSAPNFFFEAHMDHPDWEVYGHFAPLIPFPIVGHNREFAWGITMAMVDDLDFYEDRMSPDKSSVFYQNKVHNVTRLNHQIKIKGKSRPYLLETYKSPRGPMMNELFPGKNNVFMQWSFYRSPNTTLEAFYNILPAQNLEEFKSAISLGTSPSVNVVYADRLHNIGWWLMGTIPLRHPHIRGDVLLNGENPNHEYIKYLDFKERPSLVNPISGVIISANSRPLGLQSGVQGYWAPDDRFKLIEEQLRKNRRWDSESTKQLQNSTNGHEVRQIMEFLLISLNKLKRTGTPVEKASINLLEKWNFSGDKEQIAPTIYYLWLEQIYELLMDEIPLKERALLCKRHLAWRFFKRLMKDKYSNWWNLNVKDGRRADPSLLLLSSFKKTIRIIIDKMGPDMKLWKWGKAHKVHFPHFLKDYPVVGEYFNRGPFRVSGGPRQLNNLRWDACTTFPFKVNFGPAVKRIIDFSDIDTTMAILPLGQSGHMFSKHYDDQSESFFSGKYRFQFLNYADITRYKEGIVNYVTP